MIPFTPTRSSRLTDRAALSFAAALALWYLGGDHALDRLLEVGPLWAWCAGPGVAVAAWVGLRATTAFRGRVTVAVFAGISAAWLLAMVLALANRWLDHGTAVAYDASILRFREPSKGPRRVELELDGTVAKFHAGVAESCTPGPASASVRPGALGWPWLEALRCGERSPVP